MGSPLLLVLHPARGTDLWYCFAGIALVSLYGHRLEAGHAEHDLGLLAYLASILIWRPLAAASILFGVLGLTWEPARRWTQTAAARSVPAVLAVVCVLGSAGSETWGRARTEGVRQALIHRPEPEIERIASWAREHTARDAVFLIHPGWGEFRALALRPVFTTYKDGSALLWDRGYVTAWSERLQAFGLDVRDSTLTAESLPDELTRRYLALDDATAGTLRDRYRVRYWVLPRRQASTYRAVYSGGEYQVVDLTRSALPAGS
jgi:hypothetical protein